MNDTASSEDKHANNQMSSGHVLFLNVEGDMQINFHYIDHVLDCFFLLYFEKYFYNPIYPSILPHMSDGQQQHILCMFVVLCKCANQHILYVPHSHYSLWFMMV